MKPKVKELLERIESAGRRLLNELEGKPLDKDSEVNVPEALSELRRAVAKGKSTSGLTLGARELQLAFTKLDECDMWANEGKAGLTVAKRRATECLLWARRGLSIDQVRKTA